MPEDVKQPILNWPEEENAYKVLQLVIDDVRYLVFPQDASKYAGTHGAMMQFFLQKHGIEYEEVDGRDGKYTIPAPKGERYELVGAGHAFVNVRDKLVNFGDSSYDYKMGINEEWIGDIRKNEPDFDIRIEK